MADEEKRVPFQTDNTIEDLRGYAQKIEALGMFWGALAWHENRRDGSTETFENYGETMGAIIKDYAEAIGIILDGKRVTDIHNDNDIFISIGEIEEAFKWLSNTPGQQDIYIVGYHLGKLREFRKSAFMADEWIGKFENLLQKKQKSAPEAVAQQQGLKKRVVT